MPFLIAFLLAFAPSAPWFGHPVVNAPTYSSWQRPAHHAPASASPYRSHMYSPWQRPR